MRSSYPGPPYSPPANFAVVIAAWRDRGTPSTVDREWFARIGLSPNLTTRNLHALRYLRLVDESARPTEIAERLRIAPSESVRSTLAGIARAAYADVWALCDPARASRIQIEDAFRHRAPPAQRSRMAAFFLGLCEQAGIRSARAPRSRVSRPARAVTPLNAAAAERGPASVGEASPLGGRASTSTVAPALQYLLAKFPDFDPAWPAAVQEKWFDAFSRLREDVLRASRPVSDRADPVAGYRTASSCDGDAVEAGAPFEHS